MATLRRSAQTQVQSTFLWEEHPASLSRSQESVSDWMTRAVTSPLSISAWLGACAPAGSSGKTSPVSFPLSRMKRTVKAVFSQELKDAKPETNGLKKVILRPFSHSFGNAGMGSPTEFLTLNMSEWTALDGLSLSDDGVCSLSDILETGDVPPQYYLSPKACAGILRRAANRGKDLPPMLLRALSAVAGVSSEPVKPEAKIQ